MASNMTIAKRLEGLARIADLVLDQRLQALQRAQQARNATREKIQALDQPWEMDEHALQASVRAAFLYQTWADLRRKDLNLVLAKQTVVVLETEADARLSFSRHAALEQLRAQKR
jgi:hypothetical protein